jgi:AcrR family transcriptional regulator
MRKVKLALKPRKLPVQARSKHTIDAIFEATIQVLLVGGVNKLTTTKVADRAGVSVGTLYQYFPNKNVLLGALLELHLLEVVEAIEASCLKFRGAKLDLLAKELVDVYLNVKLRSPEVSVALYSVAVAIEAIEIVQAITKRTQVAVSSALESVLDRQFDELDMVTIVFTTSLMGPIQAFLLAKPPKAVFERLRMQLQALTKAYLKASSVKITANKIP